MRLVLCFLIVFCCFFVVFDIDSVVFMSVDDDFKFLDVIFKGMY